MGTQRSCSIRLREGLSARLAFFIAMTCCVTTTVEAQNVTVLPANPTGFESVIARINIPNCFFDSSTVRVKQEGTAIRVDFNGTDNCSESALQPSDQDIRLGHFPPGIFSVVVFQTSYVFDTSFTTQWGSAQFTVTDSYATKTGPFPLVDYTDHWWNPQESGWGLSIMQHPSDRIFAAWFVYDQAGQPTWYTLQPGQWLTATSYTGPIYKTTGPYFGSTFDPNQVGVNQVGTGTLVFTDYSNAVFTYTVDGKDGSKAISRLPF